MKALKRRIPLLLSMIFFFSLVLMPHTVEAKSAKAVRLDAKKITVSAGKSKRLKLLNNKKKTSWSIVSGKNSIQLKKKGKSGVTIVGKKAGKAVIRAKAGKKVYTCRVTVNSPQKAKTVELSSRRLTVETGRHTRLELKNNKKKVSWSIVSGKNCVQLQKKGKTGVTIVGKKAGKAVIRATVDKKKYTCNVTVKEAKKDDGSPSENPSKPEDNITPEEPTNPEEPTEPEEPVTPENPTVGDKSLIAYFSMIELVPEGADAATHATPSMGNTESVAMEIQKQTGGDLFAIKTVREYPADHRECSKIASEELEKDARPELSTHIENMSDYKTIYIGFPIWVYREPMAIRTFLEEYDFSGKTIIPFCTSMAVGIDASVEDIKSLCPKSEILEGLRLSTEKEDYSGQVSGWLSRLGMTIHRTTPIVITAGDKVLNGYLYDNEPAKSLMEKLPLTVTLNDSDNDFCGGNIDISYGENDVQNGYKNGDLDFWTPGRNFVIFVDDEEKSADTGNLVILGHLTESQEVLDSLEGTLEITVDLAGSGTPPKEPENLDIPEPPKEPEIPEEPGNGTEDKKEMKLKITVSGQELTATLEDNATTRALMEKLPMTLPMLDLYGREMCYRFDDALPTDSLTSSGYEVGDLAYWPPRHSFVILYKQNGERFEKQHLGHIDSGVEIFNNIGNVDVTFDIAE